MFRYRNSQNRRKFPLLNIHEIPTYCNDRKFLVEYVSDFPQNSELKRKSTEKSDEQFTIWKRNII